MNQLEIPDIKAKITVTGKDFLWSGCRPAHSGGLYLTTGLHTYKRIQEEIKLWEFLMRLKRRRMMSRQALCLESRTGLLS